MAQRRRGRSGRGSNGRSRAGRRGRTIRYAVVGLGHIAQMAVLPAFAHARGNSELTALVSGDADKLKVLGRRYGVDALYDYDDFDECLESGDIDAVYIALPNAMHREFVERAARAGIHVLCEKPLGVTEAECLSMIRACDGAGVFLMTAYRLHFEPANLAALATASSGKLGELRLFSSVFTMQVRDDRNIRLVADLGGGPLADIGIYCINAARTLFKAEPVEVFAWASNSGDPRFREVDETVSATLRFPDQRLASFVCSFGAADVAAYQLVGTRGDVRLDPAYEYAEGLRYRETIGGKVRERHFAKRDQFGAELVYFSKCVATRREPEPSGWEGLADVRVIAALNRSLEAGEPVRVPTLRDTRHPTRRQQIDRPPTRKRRAFHAKGPSST